MFDYVRLRASETIKDVRSVVLATSGPAGVQANEFTCEAHGLLLYLLLPQTSDHLYNLEHDSQVTLLAHGWQVKGNAQVITAQEAPDSLRLLQNAGARWSTLLRIEVCVLQITGVKGWGNIETIDLTER